MKILFRIIIVAAACGILTLGILWKRSLSERINWRRAQFGSQAEQRVAESRLCEILSQSRKDSDELFDNACRAAALWDGNIDQFVPAIQRGLAANTKGETGQGELLDVLALIGTPSNGAQQVLLDNFDSIDWERKWHFFEAIGNVGLSAALIDRLISDVEKNPARHRDSYGELNHDVLRLLDQSDGNCRSAIPRLIEYLKSSNKDVRVCAYHALYHIGAISFKDDYDIHADGYDDHLAHCGRNDEYAKGELVWAPYDPGNPVIADKNLIPRLRDAFRRAGASKPFEDKKKQYEILEILETIGPGAAPAIRETIAALRTDWHEEWGELHMQASKTFDAMFSMGTPQIFLEKSHHGFGDDWKWSNEFQQLATLLLRDSRRTQKPRDFQIERMARIPEAPGSSWSRSIYFWNSGRYLAHMMVRFSFPNRHEEYPYNVSTGSVSDAVLSQLTPFVKRELEGEMLCLMASCDSETARLAGDLFRRIGGSGDAQLPFLVFSCIGYPDPVFHWRMVKAFSAVYGVRFLACEFLSLACIGYTVVLLIRVCLWLKRSLSKTQHGHGVPSDGQ